MTFLTFDEAKESYNARSPELRFFRKIWDSYEDTYMPQYRIGNKECMLVRIKDTFGKYEPAARYMRPLGDFKDYGDEITEGGVSHQRIYEDWVRLLVTPRTRVKDGEKLESTYLKLMWFAYKAAQKEWFGAHRYDREYFFKGLSFMLFNTAWGVIQEINTINKFKDEYTKFGLTVMPAEARDEGRDVDMIVVNDRTGKKYPVSIKNGNALSAHTVNQKRNVKGKKDPVFYAGLDTHGRLSFLDDSGKPINSIRIKKLVGASTPTVTDWGRNDLPDDDDY